MSTLDLLYRSIIWEYPVHPFVQRNLVTQGLFQNHKILIESASVNILDVVLHPQSRPHHCKETTCRPLSSSLEWSNSFFDFSCLFSKSFKTFLRSCISALTSGCLSRLSQKAVPLHGPLLHLFLLCPAE